MKRSCFQHGAPVLLAAALALPLAACGYKNNPVPPQRLVPQAITDLKYQLGKDGATLTWSYPQKTVSGKDLGRVRNFLLYRAVVPVADYCEKCPIPFLAPVSLDGGALPDKGGRTGSYNEPILRPGNMYFYKIRCSNGWLSESADSNVVSFLWDTPAAAPTGLLVRSVRGKNQLNWTAVTKNQDGSAITHPVRYQVLRKVDDGAFTRLGAPVSETTYTDGKVQSGQSYTYQVQSLSVFKQGLVEGGLSDTASATSQGREALRRPEPPQAVITDTGVKVFWNHAQTGNLAGYRIYRRAAGETSARKIGEVNLPYNMYIDKSAPKGVALYYSVSSVDSQNPANESSRTAEVQAEE